MQQLTLVIGSKYTSSWSLRPWMALKIAGLPFDERIVDLDSPDRKALLAAASPSAKVPMLIHGDLKIWDSLAICEYVGELACAQALWPENRGARAVARAISAEMHSGFPAMRKHLSMNCKEDFPGFVPPDEALPDIARVQQIWREARATYGVGGDFLFGRWSLADAMYAPVVFRFKGYDVKLDPVCEAYCQAMLALPAMQQWKAESF